MQIEKSTPTLINCNNCSSASRFYAKNKLTKCLSQFVLSALPAKLLSHYFACARGEVFVKEQPLILHLHDIPPMAFVLEGVVMELANYALSTSPTTGPAVGFKNAAAAFIVGSMPRKEGMDRKDLVSENVEIFKVQSQALDQELSVPITIGGMALIVISTF